MGGDAHVRPRPHAEPGRRRLRWASCAGCSAAARPTDPATATRARRGRDRRRPAGRSRRGGAGPRARARPLRAGAGRRPRPAPAALRGPVVDAAGTGRHARSDAGNDADPADGRTQRFASCQAATARTTNTTAASSPPGSAGSARRRSRGASSPIIANEPDDEPADPLRRSLERSHPCPESRACRQRPRTAPDRTGPGRAGTARDGQARLTTCAPRFRGETTAIRPVRSVSAAAAPNAASIRVIVRTESEKARTVEPAPDRHAPIAPALRAASTSCGSCG